jgi:hypothetical protein
MVDMRQALGVDDFNQMSNYTGQLQNKRRAVGQKQYGLGGKVLNMAAALGDAYNQYQPPETALGMMALPAKAVYGLGNMIVQDVGDKTKSIMGTDRSNPAAMNQAATDAFGLAADTMAGGGVVSRMTDMPQGAILGANVFQGGPHKYGPEGASESLKHMSKGEGAQAYGYGRYDAENDIVAGQYRANVRNIDEEAFKKAGFTDSEIKTARQYASEYLPEESDMAASAFSHWLGKELKPETNLAFKEAMGEGSYLYKHDLPDEDIARYLDWDAPLSEQPESVRAALESVPAYQRMTDNPPSKNLGEYTGSELYSTMEGSTMSNRDMSLGSRQAASEALAKAGIPGLKYFDGMSRNNPKQVFVNGMPIDSRDIYGNIASDLFVDAGGDFQVAIKNAKSKDAIEVLKDWANDPGMAQITDVGTRNFVTWDQDVLNRMKLLERNNEDMTKALMPK